MTYYARWTKVPESEVGDSVGDSSLDGDGLSDDTTDDEPEVEMTAPAKGKTFTVDKCTYRITDTKKYTVSIIGTSIKGKLVIGKNVRIGGKVYKVTGILRAVGQL